MSRMKYTVGLMAFVLALATGCATKPKETGFLSTYANLEKISDTRMRYIASNDVLRTYSKLIIDPVEMRFYDSEAAAKVDEKDQKHMEQYTYQALQKALGAKYALVAEPGPGVARLRVALTNLKASTPALNILPQTKLTGLGLGEVSAEMELVDSQSGRQLAAAIESDTGSRLSLSGLSKWGDAEAVVNDWCDRIAKRLEESKGK